MNTFEKYIDTYAEYLEDIRRRLYRIVLIFIGAFFIGFFATTPLVKLLVSLLHIDNAVFVATSPFQLVELAMNIGLFCAIIVTLPYLTHQIYGFLRSGLRPQERRLFFFLIPVGVCLFLLGFAYGVVILYYALGFIAQVNVGLGVVNLWDISRFLSQILLTSALLGLIFEFPIVLSFLIRLGVLNTAFLASKRRHAILVILVFVALLPPTDGLSFIVMSVPLVGMYELTILLNSYKRGSAIL